MIYKPDQNVLRALAALQSNGNFQVFVKYLDECLQKTDADNRKSVEEYKARWLQGQAQDLAELLSLIDISKRL